MYEEPEERSSELAADPKVRAREKADELALHAELAAAFEGPRKFDAEVLPGLAPDAAREVQRTIGRLEKAKADGTPLLPPASVGEAAAMLDYPASQGLSTNDYHVYRRPGETMIVRWLAGGEVDSFYHRFQAHFEAALNGFRDDERSSNEWRGDEATNAYLDALDAIDRKAGDHYLREPIQKHKLFVLSTLTVDEMDVLHLCDTLMGVTAEDVVGPQSAPPADDPSDRDRAWFFKLFSLRGLRDGQERMCLFTYLQKTEDDYGF